MKKLILLTLIPFLAHFANAQWQQTTYFPASDGVRCLASNGNNIFAGTFQEGVYLSNDSGLNWVAVNNGLITTYPVMSLATKDSIIFAGINDMYISTNNGANWADINMTNYGIVNTIVVSGDSIYAGAVNYVYFSNNNGEQWNLIGNNLTGGTGLVTSLVVSGNNIFAGTSKPPTGVGIFLSTNNGASWTAVNTGLTNKNIRSMALNGSTIFAGTDGSGVYLSTNNGSNWVASNGSTGKIYSFVTSGNNIFAGSDNGVFLSTNNGGSWVNIGLSYVSSLAIGGNYIYAGGSGVWKRSLAEILASVKEQSLTKYSMYPNPANNNIHIEAGNITKGAVVYVYNMNLQIMLQQPLQNKTTEMDISGLNPGIYFVKMQNEETVKVWKLIKE